MSLGEVDTLNLLSEKLENLSRINIQKCISWCSKHNVAHNNFSNSNIFLLNEDDED